MVILQYLYPTFNLNSPQLLSLYTVDVKMYMYSRVSASFWGLTNNSKQTLQQFPQFNCTATFNMNAFFQTHKAVCHADTIVTEL